jgi:hypothetical protein
MLGLMTDFRLKILHRVTQKNNWLIDRSNFDIKNFEYYIFICWSAIFSRVTTLHGKNLHEAPHLANSTVMLC